MAVIGSTSKSKEGTYKGGGTQAVHYDFKQGIEGDDSNQDAELAMDQTPPDENAPGSPLRDMRQGRVVAPAPFTDEYSQIESVRGGSGDENTPARSVIDEYSQVRGSKKNEDSGPPGA